MRNKPEELSAGRISELICLIESGQAVKIHRSALYDLMEAAIEFVENLDWHVKTTENYAFVEKVWR